MVFRASLIKPLAVQGGIFVCGALAWLTAEHHLYATMCLCILMAAGAGAGGWRWGGRGGDRAAALSSPVAGDAFPTPLPLALLDQTPSPLLLQSGDGPLQAVNRAARALFATSRDVSGADKRALLGDGELLLALPRRLRWRDRHYAVQFCRLEAAGEVSHLATLTDISAEVRAAEAAALRDVLQILNHELMNAVTPVASLSRSALDLLRDAVAPTAAITALERVAARTEGLVDFVEAYRTLSRLPPPDRVAVPLAPFIEDVAHLFRARWAEQGVPLAISYHPEAAGVFVDIDPDQMQLCLANLLNNAADAVRGQVRPQVRLRVNGAEGENRRVLLRIEDNGPGIPAHLREDVFRPFHTTKAGGTGVGLPLARQIMQGHGSTLRLLTAGEAGADALPGAIFRLDLEVAPGSFLPQGLSRGGAGAGERQTDDRE